MKNPAVKLVFLVLILSLLVACDGQDAQKSPLPEAAVENPVSPKDTEAPQENPVVTDESFIEGFRALLPTVPGIEDIEVLVKELSAHSHELSKEAVSESLGLIKTVQDSALENHPDYGGVSDSLAASLFEKGSLKTILENPSLLENPVLEEEIRTYQDNFFTIDTAEGMFYLVVDFHRYLAFKDEITREYLSYLEIMARELDNPTFRDAAMTIGLDTLWDRVTAVEEHLRHHQDNEDLPWYYQTLLYALIYGGNNTPVYAYDTGRMSQERIDFYQTHSLPAASPLYEDFEAFKAAVKKSDYLYTEAVENTRTKIMETFEATYSISY